MPTLVVLGIAGLVLGVAGGLFGGPTWLAAGSLVFGIAMIAAYGYVLFNGPASGIEPYHVAEEPPEIAPMQGETELRRKDRGTVRKEQNGAF